MQKPRRYERKCAGFSDDYVAEGYFDQLYRSAVASHAELAVGQVICVSADGVKYLQRRCAVFPYLLPGEKPETVYQMFWRQEGRCYHWHVVWNKIYRNTIIKKTYSSLAKQKRHLVMMEDFIFSSLLLGEINRYAVNTDAKYFYVEHADAVTRKRQGTDIVKNLKDITNAFRFVEGYLSRKNDKEYVIRLQRWRERYARIWRRILSHAELGSAEQEAWSLLSGLSEGEITDVTKEDEYYYELADFL